MATGLRIRSAQDADWPAMRLLAATCFGAFRASETTQVWRDMMPADSVVVACDGPQLVGMAVYLDLRLTVPGGTVLPLAGTTWVAVSPTHRRRGVLREMFVELHERMAAASYPIAGLQASEGGIYGRFGYGPATIRQTLSIARREAGFHADVPDPGGVRLITPADHRDVLEEIYERWRLQTPGGLHSPRELWDEVLTDREGSRGGGSPLFGLLHDDGFAFYRVHGGWDDKSATITKLTALTPTAHIALWRTMLGLDLMTTVVTDTHHRDVLPYLLTDPRLVRTTGCEDALWLRMIDVPAVLEARRYSADLSLVLDAGGGRYRLDVRDGRAQCEPSDAEPDVRTDLDVLGSIYLGAHLPSSYASANRLRCNDSAVVRALEAAFAWDVPAEIGYGF